MKGNDFKFAPTSRWAIWGMAACLCLALGLVTTAAAAPVTYTGFTITDGQIGTWQFHNARVVLRFDGDTNNVQLVQFPDPFDPTATAQVAIIYGNRIGDHLNVAAHRARDFRAKPDLCQPGPGYAPVRADYRWPGRRLRNVFRHRAGGRIG